MSWGTLYGIGVGPGDPELLTLKAYKLLATVPVIFYPASGGKGQGFALDILRRAFASVGGDASPNPAASRCVIERCRPLAITMLRGSGGERPHWRRAAETVGQVLQTGEDAAFITEGDPSLYSTFMYLRNALAQRFPEVRVEVVPAVSSITAAAAAALFPLALADERLAVLPATFDPEFLEQALETFDTVVLMKVSRVLEGVLAMIERHGLLDRAVFVERCGTPHERVIRDLTSLRGQPADYFSVLLVRKHAAPTPGSERERSG